MDEKARDNNKTDNVLLIHNTSSSKGPTEHQDGCMVSKEQEIIFRPAEDDPLFCFTRKRSVSEVYSLESHGML